MVSPFGLFVGGGFSLFSFPLIVKFDSFTQSFSVFKISLTLCCCSLAVKCLAGLVSSFQSLEDKLRIKILNFDSPCVR